jgi:hypothetical protein
MLNQFVIVAKSDIRMELLGLQCIIMISLQLHQVLSESRVCHQV